MNAVLLDTGCIVALLDRSEEHHEQCMERVDGLDAALLTCEAVVAEACYLLRGLAGAAEAVLDNVTSGVFLIPHRIAESAARVAKLMKRYRNVPMDLADACLVDMAAQHKTGRILTLDRDFMIYRWAKNRPFELLIDM